MTILPCPALIILAVLLLAVLFLLGLCRAAADWRDVDAIDQGESFGGEYDADRR